VPDDTPVIPPAEDPRAASARLERLVEALRAAEAERDAEREARRAAEAERDAEREERRLLELRLAELERRLGMGSDDSGTPPSKESIEAREKRKAARREARDVSSRERSKDRKRGGQPGHPGSGLRRDPDPGETRAADPPAECSSCGCGLAGAAELVPGWAQVWDVEVRKTVVEYLLPRLLCPCGKATAAAPPEGRAGTVCYGPNVNAAAVILSSFGNVPTERAAEVLGMLLGVPVSAGFVDLACARLSGRLDAAGFDEAMKKALLAEPVLGADETPVEVLRPDVDEQTGEPVGGAAHVLVVQSPGAGLVWLRPLPSRGWKVVTAVLAAFTGYLVVDGYGAYQELTKLAGVQQCVAHVIRRARQVAKLGPGGVQNWTKEVRAALGEAHDAVTEAKKEKKSGLDPELLAGLRKRYDDAVALGLAHNKHRDWDGGGNHPGYKLARWLAAYADQVWLFTTIFDLEWTNNASERGVKDPKRHQAVSGYWHTQATLGRYCRIRSYLISARNHGVGASEAIRAALAGTPWLPTPRPAAPAAAA
jgi:hypothetical protein